MPRKKVQDHQVVEVDFAEQERRLARRLLSSPKLGEIVNYVMPRSSKIRPAIVVEVWEEARVNLLVFTDGRNDGRMSPVEWASNVPFSDGGEPMTWHFAR